MHYNNVKYGVTFWFLVIRLRTVFCYLNNGQSINVHYILWWWFVIYYKLYTIIFLIISTFYQYFENVVWRLKVDLLNQKCSLDCWEINRSNYLKDMSSDLNLHLVCILGIEIGPSFSKRRCTNTCIMYRKYMYHAPCM